MFYFYVFEYLFAGCFDLSQRNRKDKYFDKTTPTPWLTRIRFTRISLKQGQTSTSVMAVYRIHYFLLFYVEPLIDSKLNQSMALHKQDLNVSPVLA